jgi:hypothetical protein
MPDNTGNLDLDIRLSRQQQDLEPLTLGYLVAFPSFPTASEKHRGRVAIKFNAAGVADEVRVCYKKADDSYDWLDMVQVQGMITAHEADTANPHDTTAEQVGALTLEDFEYGSSASGKYRKHPDGTLECWGTYSVSISSGSSSGYGEEIVYPVPFVGDDPSVTMQNYGNSSTLINAGVQPPTTESLLARFRPYVKQSDTTARTHNGYWRAIGRWKT